MLTLNYKEFGQGEPLLILHGLFGSSDNWQTLAKRFAEHYTVYIIDQRNHGRSPFSHTHTYQEMADDLNHFMERHWIHKAHLLGHSMGGKTVLQFAEDHTDKVDKLIVADMGIKANQGDHSAVFQAIFAVDFDQIESRKEAEAVMRQYLKEDTTVQFLLKNLSRNPENGKLEWKMNVPVLHSHYAHILGAISFREPLAIPACFIRGEQSDYIQDNDIPAIQQVFPNSSFVTIPKAGHWIHAEQPIAFAEAVEQFLLKK